MTQIDGILQQMTEAEADAARQTAVVEQNLGGHRKTLATWSDQGLAAQAMAGHEAEATEARARIEDGLTRRLRDLRRQGNAALEADREAVHTAIYAERLKRGPQGAEAWAEANARAPFVREDLEAMHNPADVVAYYERAKAAGDRVAQWLTVRYGRARLEAGIQERAGSVGLGYDWHRALSALDTAIGDELSAKEQAQLDALHDKEMELHRLRTATEQAELARKYGIRTYT